MKRILFFLLSFLPLAIMAQDSVPMTELMPATGTSASDTIQSQTDNVAPAIRFGYLSYDSVLKGMPDYAVAQDSIQAERDSYENEMRRVENDFNKKYEAFLEGQRDFPRTILLKRQTELQDMMKRNVEFKAQARQDLQKAQERYLAPVKARLNTALADLAREYQLAFVLNTDGNACPFIDPVFGMDLQQIAIEYLK